MSQFPQLIAATVARRKQIPSERALLVGISGIDASGKGFVATQAAESLGRATGIADSGYNVAVIGVDGWLNLPHVRFHDQNPAEHFYQHALRFDEMFERLIVPLRENRSLDLEMDFTEETAASYRKHRHYFRDIDVILLEGIFLFKRRYRPQYDLACWIECSFETALARGVRRCQEGLPPSETVRAFETIYFPAQRLHFDRDNPRASADLIISNS